MTVARRLKEFHADDRGAITPLMLVLFITLVIITGLAIDMVRHEAERADLQDALDRGVLAAAQFGQDVDPQVVVEEYVRSRNFGDSEVDLTVQFTAQTPYERRIDADALYDMDTVFMAMTGVDTLGVAAGASALQGRTAIEISLVLDISGTMRYSSRIENLRIAANEFITEMLADGADSYTTISIVPYAGQVNPGPEMFSALGGVRWHAFSSCPEFTASDFGLDPITGFAATGLPDNGPYDQVPHFHKWTIDWAYMDWGWCPADPVYSFVDPLTDAEVLSGSKADLQAYRDGLAATATADIAAELQGTLAGLSADPEAAAAATAAAAASTAAAVDAIMAYEYQAIRLNGTSISYLSNNADALTARISAMRLHDGTGTYNGMKWGLALLDPDSRATLDTAGVIESGFTDRPSPWGDAGTMKVVVLMTDGQITEQHRPTSTDWADLAVNEADAATTQTYSRADGLQDFYDLCSAARTRGVEVFTIAFEAPGGAKTEMQNCANWFPGTSDLANQRYYEVEGLEIVAAFRDIRAQLAALKLVN